MSKLTDNGRQDAFSSQFTQRTGLEIVQPLINSFNVSSPPSSSNPSCSVAWDCRSNPAGIAVSLEIITPALGVTLIPGLPLIGSHTFTASGPGTYFAKLNLSLDRNGETRTASQVQSIPGV